MKIFVVHIILLVIPFAVAAQSSKLMRADSSATKSSIKCGLRYTSDYFFMGRSDSAKAPYLSPSIGYYHRSGLFIRGSLSYLTSSEEARIDMYSFSGGYDYNSTKFSVGGSLTGYVFSDLSYVVQAEMNTYVNAYTGYDFNYVVVFIDASMGFSKISDFFLGVDVSRTFYVLNNKLQITPSVLLNAGTQEYYNQYYSQRSMQTGYRKGKGGGYQKTVTEQYTIKSTQFQLLDYEADLQVSYRIGKTKIFVASTWTFPVNPARVITPEGTYTEQLKNGFFWTTGIRLNLEFKK